MDIEKTISRMCNQTVVYWGSPLNDGYGGKVFANPVEIQCHWEDVLQTVRKAQGEEIMSKSVVYPLQDLDEEGWLFLGTLDDLYDLAESSFGAISNPLKFDGAYEIKRFDKLSNLKATEYVRKAYL